MSWWKKLWKKKPKHVFSNVAKYNNLVTQILEKVQIFAKLSNEELQAKTAIFKKALAKNNSLDDILVDAYALVYEGSKRVLGLTPHQVQVYGAVVLHNGDIAEMKTGEGKTLASTMPIYLNALLEKGVHVATVNDYLAQRDTEEMGKLFNWLGLSVAHNSPFLSKSEKKEVYAHDITYSTHSEIGFDYLRDNMVKSIEDKVQRGLNFAIIDECDSILIDDARTPLIISSSKQQNVKLYQKANSFVKTLLVDDDYQIDLKLKTIYLTSQGSKKAEKFFNVDNLFNTKYTILIHYIQQALKAHHILKSNIDYIVQNGEIAIIDENTGRVLKGRSYSDGLHQAIETKENLTLSSETKTVATITYQNLFRLYDKLAGMTGTAKTEEEEFLDIYNMHVEAIKTNLPIIRNDDNDVVFGYQKAAHQALVAAVEKLYAKKQPVLIGTRNVETSEIISQLLSQVNVSHVVLNAKNHAKESEIIKLAGQKGKITIATNMAGRGADIKLGKGVAALGGLAILACERNESRRIDNQLIGRAGRQGFPGYSKFFISWEDELIIRFVGDKSQFQARLLNNQSVESKVLTRVIMNAQKQVEGQNYDARKDLVSFDDVVRLQRETIYKQRDNIIFSDNLLPIIKTMYKNVVQTFVNRNIIFIDKEKHVDGIKVCQDIDRFKVIDENNLDAQAISVMSFVHAANHIEKLFLEQLETKSKELNTKDFNEANKLLLLDIVDNFWQQHIDTMSKLRSGIHLRSYSQRSPLQAYIQEGYQLFETMKSNIALTIMAAINKLKINHKH